MGKSSKDKRDIYYRFAKEQGWRARSAFKLIHINENFNIFEGVTKVVDLCAAPGSWSQVLVHFLTSEDVKPKIVAVDLQEMAPIPGVHIIKGDITDVSTAREIISHFEGDLADLVICDGAPDVTGLHDLDEYLQSQLVVSAVNITTHVLRAGGTFISKIFRGKDTDFLFYQLGELFKDIAVAKPKSSRHSSVECFVVCKEYTPPEGFVPSMDNPHVDPTLYDYDTLDKKFNKVFRFVSCGDLSGYDSDMTYPLNSSADSQNYQSKEVIQPPISAAYQFACELRKKGDIKEY